MEISLPFRHELDRVDDATATLILQLQNRDIEELVQSRKGKGRDGEILDADLAKATYQQELQETARIRADRSMAQSFMQAVISDAALLNEALAAESAASADRALAYRLAGVNAPPAAPEQTTAGGALDDGFLARLAALYISDRNDQNEALEENADDGHSVGGESAAWAASRQKPLTAVYRQCIVCDLKKPLFETFQTPCGHDYCQECLHTLFSYRLRMKLCFHLDAAVKRFPFSPSRYI